MQSLPWTEFDLCRRRETKTKKNNAVTNPNSTLWIATVFVVQSDWYEENEDWTAELIVQPSFYPRITPGYHLQDQ